MAAVVFCSACAEPVTVDPAAGTVRAVVASNGLRGSLHVPAHEVSGDVFDDAGLLTWECPRCGHADSLDPQHQP